MHLIGITIGIVALIVAICLGLAFILLLVWVALMTAAAIIYWTITFICFLFGLTAYPSFLSIWHYTLFVESSGGD